MAEIPAPILDTRDEEQMAAEAIGFVSSGLTVERIDKQIEERLRVRELLLGNTLTPAICPELTNSNNSAQHTVLLEAMAWLLGQFGWRINLFPLRDAIEFHRLFKIELRESEPATTTLRFFVAPPVNVDVTIPLGTQITTQDNAITFETTEEITIPYGEPSGDAAARCTVPSEQILSPNVLTKLVDAPAWVEEVTNPEAVSSGSNTESVEEALERARNYQQRAERIVSSTDLEKAILEDVLKRNGIVRVFPFVRQGDFASQIAGHTTVVVMTKLGNPVSIEQRQAINTILEQMIGNQFIYVIDPIFVTFNVAASVRLREGALQSATLATCERNLRAFYAASREIFGRDILRSEIIAVIEGTQGIDRIVAPAVGDILASPIGDTKLSAWQLPKLINVSLEVL